MAFAAAALPIIALGALGIGTGLNVFGQFRAASIAKDQAGLEQNILGNQLTALRQEKEVETQDEKIRQRLIASETKEEQGAFQVAAAGRGVVVNQGSAGIGHAEIAAEGKYKQLLSGVESFRRKRNIDIQLTNTMTSLQQSRLRSRAEQKAAKIRIGSTALTAGIGAASTFKIGADGDLKFRTAA